MKAVIDTNVLLAANNKHQGLSLDCVLACIKALEQMQNQGVVVIDNNRHIIGEYCHKTSPNQPKGVGDVFLKWLLNNHANPQRIHQVSITKIADNEFAEFPDAVLQQKFDPPDRKFVVVAKAHPDKPEIWQAADCKWLDWFSELQTHGLKVKFLCPEDICQFYQNKFPNKSLPDLPEL